MSADKSTRVARLGLARVIAAVLALIAIIALAAMALSTKTEKVALVTPLAAGGLPPELVPSPAAPAEPSTGPSTSVGSAAAGGSVSPGLPIAQATTGPVRSPAASPVATRPTTPTRTPAVVNSCPLGLPAPKQTGGLASLVGIVPVFGPFSAEAFAFSPAYEPLLKLFGPFLPAFQQGLATADPLTTPVIGALRTLEDAGFGAVGPLYGPYRQQILADETAAANAIGVYTAALANSTPASCLIDAEGIIAP